MRHLCAPHVRLWLKYGSRRHGATLSGLKALGGGAADASSLLSDGGGYATVAADPAGVVHGVLWDIALADMRALDAYEDIARGLYRKIIQPVLRAEGGAARALVYVGRAGGAAKPLTGYMEGVIAAARAWNLPERYIQELEGISPSRGGAKAASLAPVAPLRELAKKAGVGVRPRFATPFDRRD
jgi:gamma-glutamylcyclotransferase (GGCT)/AIG2-like uncharacterized protein YtfP